jgi:hypothetical protein
MVPSQHYQIKVAMTDTGIVQQTTTPGDLISQAINANLDIDKLERLLAMKERWDKDQARKLFFEALSDFQTECPELRKNKKVSFTTSKGVTEYNYAPLADIDRQIKPLLKKYGLSKRWEITETEKRIKVRCFITHTSGHSETTEMESLADESGSKNPIQAKGSAIEYMKRYTLIGALGITTADSDIDGRLPELDIDKLHKTYMDLYNQIVPKKAELASPMHPDNWAGEKTPGIYVQAIAKARKILADLTTVKP